MKLLEAPIGRIIAQHLVVVHVLAALDRGARRAAQRLTDKTIGEGHTLAGEHIPQLRELFQRAEVTVEVIRQDEDDVGLAAGALTLSWLSAFLTTAALGGLTEGGGGAGGEWRLVCCRR